MKAQACARGVTKKWVGSLENKGSRGVATRDVSTNDCTEEHGGLLSLFSRSLIKAKVTTPFQTLHPSKSCAALRDVVKRIY